MIEDNGEQIELQDFSRLIDVALDAMPVADLTQRCLGGDKNILDGQVLLHTISNLSMRKEKELLSQLDLKNRLKDRGTFITLLSAVQDREHLLKLFPQDYFTGQKHYSFLHPVGIINYRKTLNEYLWQIKDNLCKIALIDRLQELHYFCSQFFSDVCTMMPYELEHELSDCPKERRTLLVTMPGNFFRYMDAIYYFGAIAPDGIFPYLDPLKKDQLMETFGTYKTLYFSSDLRRNASFLRAERILSDYAPDSFWGRLFTNRTGAHVIAVRSALAKARAGEITTAIGLVKEVLRELPVIPKQNALYQALLYIAETNYVSLDDMIKTELASRAARVPALRVV